MSRRRILEVVWRDSMASGGQQTWFTHDEAVAWGRDDLQITTVGYVVMENDKYLVLSSSQTARAGGKVGSLWSIPAGSIIKRMRLK